MAEVALMVVGVCAAVWVAALWGEAEMAVAATAQVTLVVEVWAAAVRVVEAMVEAAAEAMVEAAVEAAMAAATRVERKVEVV
mmetsp:Transcript_17068/g.39070  ORF Transcript_17068/g.39070 Transcript_17068/m.39070 type:complete len:82 (-) Transcript_17068:668-913(-)